MVVATATTVVTVTFVMAMSAAWQLVKRKKTTLKSLQTLEIHIRKTTRLPGSAVPHPAFGEPGIKIMKV